VTFMRNEECLRKGIVEGSQLLSVGNGLTNLHYTMPCEVEGCEAGMLVKTNRHAEKLGFAYTNESRQDELDYIRKIPKYQKCKCQGTGEEANPSAFTTEAVIKYLNETPFQVTITFNCPLNAVDCSSATTLPPSTTWWGGFTNQTRTTVTWEQLQNEKLQREQLKREQLQSNLCRHCQENKKTDPSFELCPECKFTVSLCLTCQENRKKDPSCELCEKCGWENDWYHGITQCGACSGKGEVKVSTGLFSSKKNGCHNCKGTGWVTYRKPKQCSKCHGEGTVPCERSECMNIVHSWGSSHSGECKKACPTCEGKSKHYVETIRPPPSSPTTQNLAKSEGSKLPETTAQWEADLAERRARAKQKVLIQKVVYYRRRRLLERLAEAEATLSCQ